jgi:hypothetical protein
MHQTGGLEPAFLHTPLFTWLVVSLLTFTARVMHVTLMTVRIITPSCGKKLLAPLLGFFEVLVSLSWSKRSNLPARGSSG